MPLEAEDYSHRTWDPFPEGPEKLSHPESHRKISNLMNTELFYFHILNLNRGSLDTRSSLAYFLLSGKPGLFMFIKLFLSETLSISWGWY